MKRLSDRQLEILLRVVGKILNDDSGTYKQKEKIALSEALVELINESHKKGDDVRAIKNALKKILKIFNILNVVFDGIKILIEWLEKD